MRLSAVRVASQETQQGERDFPALMIGVQQRDRAAFGEIFSHFGPRVKALMLRSGATEALAEDIVQDVFLSVWRKAGQYAAGRGTVSAWIYTIARNARIDRLRRHSSLPYEDIATIELADDRADAEQELDTAQRAQRVASALVDLPQDQRQVIELAYMHDMAQSEIASRLSLPLGTVKSRMRLAYAKLKQKLEETL